MARGRLISKSWSTSNKRAAIYRTAGARAEFYLGLFSLLVVHTDDYGRMDGDPGAVKLKCDPGSPRSVEDFELALRRFEELQLITRYTVDGTIWLQVLKFDEHQPGLLSKRTAAKSPVPPSFRENPGNSVLRELNLTEEKGTEEEISAEASSAPAPFLVFTTVGPVPEWALSESQVDEWARQFPATDVRAEVRKAYAWLQANPGRRKTARGMAKFLVGWLIRTTDSGGGRGRGVTTSDGEPTAKEAAEARAYLNRMLGCPHTPRCESHAACVRRVVQQQRGRAVAS